MEKCYRFKHNSKFSQHKHVFIKEEHYKFFIQKLNLFDKLNRDELQY